MNFQRLLASFFIASSMVIILYGLMNKYPDFFENFQFSDVREIVKEKIEGINFKRDKSTNTEDLLQKIVEDRVINTEDKKMDEIMRRIDDLDKKIDSISEEGDIGDMDIYDRNNLYPTSPISSNKSSINLISFNFLINRSKNPVNELLDILDKRDIKATFFISKDWAVKNEDIVNQILFSNNQIGIYIDDYNIDNILESSIWFNDIFGINPEIIYLSDNSIPYMDIDKLGFRVLAPSYIVMNDEDINEGLNNLKNNIVPGETILFDISSYDILDIFPELFRYINEKEYIPVRLSDLFT